MEGSEERRREDASSSYRPNSQPPWLCFVCREWGDTLAWRTLLSWRWDALDYISIGIVIHEGTMFCFQHSLSFQLYSSFTALQNTHGAFSKKEAPLVLPTHAPPPPVPLPHYPLRLLV